MNWEITIAILSILSGLGILVDRFLNEEDVKKIKNQILTVWVKLSDEQFNLKKTVSLSLENFNLFFDKVYGSKHLSIRCFFRSTIFSTFSVLIMYLLTRMFFPFNHEWLSFERWIKSSDSSIFYLIIINIIIDYLSLIETRYILKRSKGKSLPMLSILLLTDITLTGLLIIIPLYPLLAMSMNPAFPDPADDYIFQFFITLFISTFFTSILFYLFFGFTAFANVLNFTRSPIRRFLERLESLKNPITSLVGAIGAIIIITKGVIELFGK
ncbi:MAG: hypothetical protein AAF363_15540 [Bacteroidota bacterium]